MLSARMRARSLLFLLAGLTWAAARAEQPSAGGTTADYERAARLRGLTQNKVFKAAVVPHWFAGGNRFWYRNDLAGGDREFILVDAVKGERKAAFDHEKLAAALSKAAGKEYKPARLPIDALAFADAGDSFWLTAEGRTWKCDPADYTLTEEKAPKETPSAPPAKDEDEQDAPRRRPRPPRGPESPDRKWTAFVKDFNLFLREKESGKEFALSQDGKADDAYTGEVFWAPDGAKLVGLRGKPATSAKCT